uniref:Uncharacterized protein n=1 Tax=Trichinella nativa TaxID=6335 RepID=A0A0V1KHX6_9BILA
MDLAARSLFFSPCFFDESCNSSTQLSLVEVAQD